MFILGETLALDLEVSEGNLEILMSATIATRIKNSTGPIREQMVSFAAIKCDILANAEQQRQHNIDPVCHRC